MNWLLVPICAFLFAVVTTKCVQAILGAMPPLLAFLASGGTVGFALCVWFVSTGCSLPGLAGVLLYAGLCEFYLFVMTVVMTSISAGILVRLSASPMSHDLLAADYDEDGMVRLRFDRLLSQKLIVRDGKGFVLTARGRRLYRILAWVRRELHGR